MSRVVEQSPKPGKVQRALVACQDALGYLSQPAASATLDFIYVDRLLSTIVEPPSDAKQKNGRRGVAIVRQWMIEDGPGVALLEILGQLLWRVVDMSSDQVKSLRQALQANPRYLGLIYDSRSTEIVLQRIEKVRQHKMKACLDFRNSLVGSCAYYTPDGSPTPDEAPPPWSPPRSSAQFVGPQEYFPVCQDEKAALAEPVAWDPSLSYNGLIKLRPATINYRGLWTNELERDLLDFYINIFAPGQTFLEAENTYLDLLSIATRSESTRHAVFSLSASYLKDYSLAGTTRYEYINHRYIALAAQVLQHDLSNRDSPESSLATGMLLVHHGVVNEQEAEMCWSWHISMIDAFQKAGCFDPASQPAVYMTYQLILALTTQTTGQILAGQPTNCEWLLQCDFRESQRICGILGISRRMLSLISRITDLAVETTSTSEEKLARVEAIEDEILMLDDWSQTATGEALDILLRIAKAYQFAARIYLLCRVLGATPLHSRVASLQAKLYELVLSLPVEGPYYTAIYPLWCCVIATVASTQAEHVETLYERLHNIRKRNKGNIGPVLTCISNLCAWIQQHPFTSTRQPGWWEEMLEAQPARLKMLSLG
ncbi:hypothetical protein VTN77DRAFT_9045 [Rasamsonia byssochlamydoides]|uniref:uncharacterized protein n=1 Tax=Rasamsonia byssochlamydoides TaxID=89139 RepID=UPI0037437CDA